MEEIINIEFKGKETLDASLKNQFYNAKAYVHTTYYLLAMIMSGNFQNGYINADNVDKEEIEQDIVRIMDLTSENALKKLFEETKTDDIRLKQKCYTLAINFYADYNDGITESGRKWLKDTFISKSAILNLAIPFFAASTGVRAKLIAIYKTSSDIQTEQKKAASFLAKAAADYV